MADPNPSELLTLLTEQKRALRKDDYRHADRLSHKINSFIQENTDIRFTRQESEVIAQSFAQVELILTSQKQAVSQQLQNLRSRKNMLKTYQDQART